MTTIFMKHTVEDYETWKQAFDANADTREEFGSPEDYRVFHEAGTPNEVVVIGEWESVEMAQRFLAESDLQEKMGDAGVISEPEVYILEEIEAKTPQQQPA